MIFTIEKSAPSALAVKEPPNSTQTESATTQKSNTAQKQPAENEKVNTAPSDIAQGERKKAGKSTTEKSEGDPPIIEKKVIENDVATLETPRVQLPEKTDDLGSMGADQSVAPNERSEQKNITLVFTAQEVDEKYLKKKNAVAEATSEEKETSTWRKVLDKAHDLKHNQDPLGDLRQKKNEILALNFKTNEQSHENQ